MQGEPEKPLSICGIPLKRVKVFLENGDFFEGEITRISKYEIVLKTSFGTYILFKHSISAIKPLD